MTYGDLLLVETLRGAPGGEPILRWFRFEHLPEHLQSVSRPFAELAVELLELAQRGPERTVALRKLLESKDAAVRAALDGYELGELFDEDDE